jgi:hypothetical protein
MRFTWKGKPTLSIYPSNAPPEVNVAGPYPSRGINEPETIKKRVLVTIPRVDKATNKNITGSAYYDPVMYNIDFSLNFKVNRENLDTLINTETSYTSLLETTFGYTGVNIKFPVNISETDFKIKYKEYSEDNPDFQLIPYEKFLGLKISLVDSL